MLFTDAYVTVNKPAQGEYKDRGSRFIGLMYPVKSEEEAKELLKQIKKEHHSAAHHCWALVLGADAVFKKSTDDREPAGTAGRPILRVVNAHNLTFVLAVVVRYFGGKLLGVPGLIAAYGEAIRQAVNNAAIVEVIIYDLYFIACTFERQHEVIKLLKQVSVKFKAMVINEQEGVIFEIKPSQVNPVQKLLSELDFKDLKWVQPGML
ncbi:MAG: YigZ family protein [Bacteroidia bacterium]|nr:YigZ family protein [Bacteroidia bacterium]